MMINLPSKLQQDLKTAVGPNGQATGATLDASQKEIFNLMVKDNFARFCKAEQGFAQKCMMSARGAAAGSS